MAQRARLSFGFAILAILAVAAVASAAAQGPAERQTPLATTQPTPDSAAVLSSARKAQNTFERVRRTHLPRSWTGGATRCDETIGRFCYWDDDDTSEYTLPDTVPLEAARISAARMQLLTRLDSASTRLPGDDWIAGQHVRYLIEAGASADAERRARACAATPWWCSALLGLARHAAWQYAAADSVFDAALAMMPDTLRCEWTDLSYLLADSVKDGYKRASCVEREAVHDWFWWLADPLHLREGNDRRTEHFARVTMHHIQRGATSGYGVAWRDDLGQLLQRYGWPSYFARAFPQAGRTEPPGVVAHHRSPSYHFVPDGDPMVASLRTNEAQFTLRPRAPRERYAPPYATFATLRQLTTLFRRGDSVLVVTAFDARHDTLMPAGPVTAALSIGASPGAPPIQAIHHDTARHGTLTAIAPDVPLLASIEIVGGNRVHRDRLGVALANSMTRSVRISEIGFFAPTDELPSTLEAFLTLALPSANVQRDGKLGLFWELYGLRRSSDEMMVRVQIIREGRSWLRRAGERIGLVGRDRTTGFGWREDERGGSVAPRSIVVDLKGLDPGEYRIEISLTQGNDVPLVAARRLEIVR